MDVTTIFGLLLGVGALIAALVMEGGRISALFQLPAVILVVFGAFGAATITTSFKQLINLPQILKVAFLDRKLDPHELINTIFELAHKTRKLGLLSLEADIERIKDPFLRKALRLAVDGFDSQKIREILDIEMSYIEERHKSGAVFFQKLGGFSPTLGIMGTVLGLIHALSNMDNTSNMASSIASAFVATLWGVGMANLVYLPISDKLKAKHEEEFLHLELVKEGIISLTLGENPRIIKTKLLSFLLPEERHEE